MLYMVLSALEVRFSRQDAIQIYVYLYLLNLKHNYYALNDSL